MPKKKGKKAASSSGSEDEVRAVDPAHGRKMLRAADRPAAPARAVLRRPPARH
jgi:hypothetical protein